MNDLDINKVLVGVLNKQIDDMLSRAKNAVAGAQERLKARFRVGFSSYVRQFMATFFFFFCAVCLAQLRIIPMVC